MKTTIMCITLMIKNNDFKRFKDDKVNLYFSSFATLLRPALHLRLFVLFNLIFILCMRIFLHVQSD